MKAVCVDTPTDTPPKKKISSIFEAFVQKKNRQINSPAKINNGNNDNEKKKELLSIKSDNVILYIPEHLITVSKTSTTTTCVSIAIDCGHNTNDFCFPESSHL